MMKADHFPRLSPVVTASSLAMSGSNRATCSSTRGGKDLPARSLSSWPGNGWRFSWKSWKKALFWCWWWWWWWRRWWWCWCHPQEDSSLNLFEHRISLQIASHLETPMPWHLASQLVYPRHVPSCEVLLRALHQCLSCPDLKVGFPTCWVYCWATGVWWP